MRLNLFFTVVIALLIFVMAIIQLSTTESKLSDIISIVLIFICVFVIGYVCSQ